VGFSRVCKLASTSIAQFFFVATDDKRIIVGVIELRQLLLQWPRFLFF
jgi:hypothetical protein